MNLIKRVLWRFTSPEVDQALIGSKQRLEEARKQRAAMQPELDRLHRHVEQNHFAQAVQRVFRVAQ